MVGHEAIGQDVDASFGEVFANEAEVELAVRHGEEDFLVIASPSRLLSP